MTLEEAIKHLEESLADPGHDWGCEECKAEHEQLLEWLKEFKILRDYFTVPNKHIMQYNAIYSALTGKEIQDDTKDFPGIIGESIKAERMNDAAMLRKVLITLGKAVSRLREESMKNEKLRDRLETACAALEKVHKCGCISCEVCNASVGFCPHDNNWYLPFMSETEKIINEEGGENDA